MTVGTYGSGTPAFSAIPSENEFAAKSQRYSRPSSLGANTQEAIGFPAAVLIHHSVCPEPEGVGENAVNTSRIKVLTNGQTCVFGVFGSSKAMRFRAP